MIKKIILGVLFVGLIGFLIFGAVNRTLAKTVDVGNEGLGGGRYQSQNDGELLNNDHQNLPENQFNHTDDNSEFGNGRQGSNNEDGLGNGYNRSENQQGIGNGLSKDDSDRTGIPDPQATAGEWEAYIGTVINADADMILVETSDGSQIVIEGRALAYALEMGFTTSVGNTLQIDGFYEDGEYKVATIEDRTTGQSIVTRDENGRPGWAGNGWGGSGSGNE